jgi:1,4-alpha-glucan branching enzyme
MRLIDPVSGGFVGGEVALQFDEAATGVTASVNGLPALVKSDGAAFAISFNGIGADSWLDVRGTVRDSGGAESEWSVRVVKPRHDLAGLGATYVVTAKGTFFKVWMPGPSQVYVRGDFNDWKDAHQLDPLGTSGYWYGFVPGAGPDQHYKFYAYLSDGRSDEVPDPASRETVSTPKGGPDFRDANAVICNPMSFQWTRDSWWADRRKRHDQHIIYQAHWGTFLRQATSDYVYETFVTGVDEAARRASVRSKLQHVADLGFTAFELLPVQESNGNADGG